MAEDLTCLAESAILELAANMEILSDLLMHDPRSEPGLTALADIALLTAVLERDHPQRGSRVLANAVRSILAAPALQAGAASPGPEEWALHAARTWLDPAREQKRLRNEQIFDLIVESERAVFALGPPWRPEEISHVAAYLTGSGLPALRAVEVDNSLMSLYELTHVAFYATDFGAVPYQDPVAANLEATASRAAGELAGTWWGYDLGVELILAARFLAGEWPLEAEPWIRTMMPQWILSALSVLYDHPEQFLGLYHPIMVTVLAVADAAANGRTK